MILILKRIRDWLLYSKKYREFITGLKVVKLIKADFQRETLRKELFETYRDIFGHRGTHEWGEYVECSACHNVYDIEKVHNLIEYVHLSNLSKNLPLSYCCHAPMEYFHNDSVLNKKFDYILNKDVSIMYILCDKKYDRIVGLLVGYIDLVEVAWNENIKDKLVLRPNDTSISPFLKERVLYIDEIGIVKKFRQGNVPFLKLFNAFLIDAKSYDMPQNILFWTSKDSKLFRLAKQLSHKIIISDLEQPTQLVITMSLKEVCRKVKIISMLYT